MKVSMILSLTATAVAFAAGAAVPTKNATPTWWGVVNNHAEFRVTGDGGVTTTYEMQVKAEGASEFSVLSNAVCTLAGTGGYIFDVPYDGSAPAVFRCRRVNADGAGAWSDELSFTETNALPGAVVSSAPYNGSTSFAPANVVDGAYRTFFTSRQSTSTDLWIGFDFGAAKRVAGVRYIPRQSHVDKLTNAVIEVASRADFTDAVVVYELPSEPQSVELYSVFFESSALGRYARIRKNCQANQVLTISELEFLGEKAALPPAAPAVTVGVVFNRCANFRVTGDALATTYRFQRKLADAEEWSDWRTERNPGEGVALEVTGAADVVEATDFRVRGENGVGVSDWVDFPFDASLALTGTPIGSKSNYYSDGHNDFSCAVDGSVFTWFDAGRGETPAYAGFDLGEVKTVTGIRYIARSDRLSRAVGMYVQVAMSADFSDAVTAHTIASTPTAWTAYGVSFAQPVQGRYVRLCDDDPGTSFCNMAEIEFEGLEEAFDVVVADLAADSADRLAGGRPTVTWTDVSAGAYRTLVCRATAAGGPWTAQAELAKGVTSWTDDGAASGVRYYYNVAYVKGSGAHVVTGDFAAVSVAYRRIHRLERTADDNTKLREGVAFVLTSKGNEGSATWKTANIFDGDTATSGSQNVQDARLGLDFGAATPVGVELVRAMNSKDRTLRLQKACIFGKNDTTMDGGAQVSVGGLPFGHQVWTSVECDDPKCYRMIYLMRPDHVNFYGCMAELELYGWTASEEADVLLAPTRLFHTVSAAGVALSWDACNLAASYRVEKRAGGVWQALGTVTEPAFADASAATDGTEASYRVVSLSAGGDEAISQAFSFVPYLPGEGDGLTEVLTCLYTNTLWSAGEERQAVTNVGVALDHDWEYTPLSPTWNQGGNTSTSPECGYNRGRWWGKLVVPFDGAYTFSTPSGTPSFYGVAIDGTWVINAEGAGDEVSGTVTLTAGEHDFYAEFQKGWSRDSKFALSWSGPVTKEVIPAAQFKSAAPYDFGDWTIERTMDIVSKTKDKVSDFVPAMAKAFPAGEGKIRINRGRAGYSGSFNRYHLLARPVKGDFTFTCHVKNIYPVGAASSRFVILLADSADPLSPQVMGDIDWTTNASGPGAVRKGVRKVANENLDLDSYTLCGDALLEGGEADLKLSRTTDGVEIAYLDANTGDWTVFARFEDANGYIGTEAVLGLAVYDSINASKDVVWEVSEMSYAERKRGLTLILR